MDVNLPRGRSLAGARGTGGRDPAGEDRLPAVRLLTGKEGPEDAG